MKKPVHLLITILATVSMWRTPVRAQAVSQDSLKNILVVKDKYSKEKRLINYLTNYFNSVRLSDFQAGKEAAIEALKQYNISNNSSISWYIESIYKARTAQLNDAENSLLNALVLTKKQPDSYLSYIFFTHLAWVQQAKGDIIETMSSYRLAKKEAIILKDAYLQVLIDINISDICYRNRFFKQALFYLDQGEGLIDQNNIREDRLHNVIYYNKAETFYRMGRMDSLAFYNQKLTEIPAKVVNRFTFVNRTGYYLLMLQHRYNEAIKQIVSLQSNSAFGFEDTDSQSLAYAYFNAGLVDSAKNVINRLLTDNRVIHPEITPQLYQVLGDIALKTNQYDQATQYYRKALQQLDDRVKRLAQAGSVSTQMRIDEMEDTYVQRDQAYRRERAWLFFAVVAALLTTGILVMIYRNVKQKRHYEKLLFSAQKRELASFNSHEVRKHLSNILGMIDTIKGSENKHEDYQQLEEHLFYSAQQLDNAIRNISQKLDAD
jgi:tetratricopeptide (TPR) repeat protein